MTGDRQDLRRARAEVGAEVNAQMRSTTPRRCDLYRGRTVARTVGLESTPKRTFNYMQVSG